MVVTNGVTLETAVTASVLEQHLSMIQTAFRRRGFTQAGDLADRHGALQLTFANHARGLARLVLLNEAVGTGEADYRGSIDVVVQSGDRFVRRRVSGSTSRDAFESGITGNTIEVATVLADSLEDKDLTESFALRPQYTAPRDLHAESVLVRGN